MASVQSRSARASVWLIAVGAAMWGLDAVFIVALLDHFSSTQIVFLEHLLLSLFVVPILIWKRQELTRLNLGDWFAVLFVAWGGSALASILFTLGFHYGNANVVLIMQKLQPVFAVLMAAWILQERVRKGYWTLLIAALIGAYLLTFGFHMPDGGTHGALIGGLCALGAAVLWGGSTVMGKRIVEKVSFTTMTALRFAAALPLLFLIVLGQHPNWHKMAVSLTLLPVWANLLFQTLVPSLISLLLYYRGLNGVRASYATIAELAFPATGLLLNWIVLHQTITVGQWIGFAVIWLAVLQLSRMPGEQAESVRGAIGRAV
ncbi:DMT family transporter [Alicyclobacillus herbarius]|uniref:DMT family transporter n=1 Tax=Alicyclobacillus herbarius TaxID=122960 RepID=UPI00235301F9|nr:EamA family transporter [Alicyclobacillus herbarius]